jgi:hypothetical protein
MRNYTLLILHLLILSCKPTGSPSDAPSSLFPAYPSWVGCYSYAESPVKALAGYAMPMQWNLQLTSDGHCFLTVDGQQSMDRILCKVSPIPNGIEVRHVADGKENPYPTRERGQVLFRLLKSGGGILTDFASMTPRLSRPSYKPGKRPAFAAVPCSEEFRTFE